MRRPVVQSLSGMRDTAFGHLSEGKAVRNAYAECVAGAERKLGELADDMAVLTGIVRKAGQVTRNHDEWHADDFAALQVPAAGSTNPVPVMPGVSVVWGPLGSPDLSGSGLGGTP